MSVASEWRRHLSAAEDAALAHVDEGALAHLLGLFARDRGREGGLSGERLRWQDPIIESMIPAKASVLDLGCGNGDLLRRLMCGKGVQGQGVELDPDAVVTCLRRQIPVMQADIDRGLRGFPDQSLDFVILEETLQALHRPVAILRDMLRVGRRAIVSFPNFGHWRVRFELGLRGRMPVTPELPYRWHDTPNIHLLTLADFLDWADEDHVQIVRGFALADGAVHELETPEDNLMAEQVLLLLQLPASA